MPRRISPALLALCLLAFALRVGAIFVLHRWAQPNAIEHRALALSLLKHGVFYFRDFNYYGPSSVQSPPYPFLLATLFKIFGADSSGAYLAAMIVNAVFGSITVWLTYLFVRVIGGREIVALIAAALVTIWPSQVYAAGAVQAIAMITCCVVAMFYFFQVGVETGRAGPWIAYSAIGCFAALTEPVLLPILAFSGLMVLFIRKLSPQQRLRNAAILFAAAVLIILPWTVRNRVVHGKWVPVKNTFWVNLWKGNNPNATGTDRLEMSREKKTELKVTSVSGTDQDTPHQYDALTVEQRTLLNRKSEADREEIFKQFTTSWIKAHPAGYLKLCAKRLGMTILFDLDNPKARNLVWIISRIILLPLTIAGLIFARKERWHVLFPLLVWGSALLTYTLTVTANRFAIPFEPLQLALAALVISKIFRKQEIPSEGFDIIMSSRSFNS